MKEYKTSVLGKLYVTFQVLDITSKEESGTTLER
jgi:hypothetical protein